MSKVEKESETSTSSFVIALGESAEGAKYNLSIGDTITLKKEPSEEQLTSLLEVTGQKFGIVQEMKEIQTAYVYDDGWGR